VWNWLVGDRKPIKRGDRAKPMICTAHKTNGEPCKAQAMKGKTVCRVHGGKGGRPPTHARYSKSLPKDLVERYEYFKSDPEILSLKPEIATARAFFERFSRQLVEGQGLSAEVGGELRAWLDQIGRITERCDKILNGERYTIRIDQLGALIEQITDAVAAEVRDPATRAAIAARIAKIGGKG
jgi:hypothetical protein